MTTTPVTPNRWFIELLLPSRTIEVRAVATDRTEEQLSADIHASVADLVSARSTVVAPPPTDATSTSPLAQQQQAPLLERRLLLAHVGHVMLAYKVAADLRQMFAPAEVPWSKGVRTAFDEYLAELMRDA
ncbi:hypothetical protein AYO49_05915 [Verrucomicrobiaceae bacterium SCGC AG-212-N21]|nr:hypothetical protein AYO49_05915 [Verrucomicrobiaceae bacterium SCGC AG-212-N21]